MSNSGPDVKDVENDIGADPLDAATVPDELDGKRLDAAAAQLFSQYSRARLQTWIADGSLLLNGAVAARSRDPVRAGDRLELYAELIEETSVQAQNIALNVVHADAAIAIINKPPGLTVHPGSGAPNSTMQNALLHRFPQTVGVPRAGIVHRLDKDTSGLLVVALTLQAHHKLVAALAARHIRREYDAIVGGPMTAGGTVDAPIGRHPRDRLKMAVTTGGRDAVTHYRVQERYTWHTWLRVKLETGRTHQIRVHMSYQKHPIVGDATYGGRMPRGQGMSEALRNGLAAFPRQALHARELELDHPVSGERLGFQAEMPADMQNLLKLLRAESPL